MLIVRFLASHPSEQIFSDHLLTLELVVDLLLLTALLLLIIQDNLAKLVSPLDDSCR